MPVTSRDITFEMGKVVQGDQMMRAECFPTNERMRNGDALMQMAKRHAEVQGMPNAAFTTAITPAGHTVTGRGTRRSHGRPFTYEFRCTSGERSTMCVTGGSRPEEFPPAQVAEFLSSVYRVGATGASVDPISKVWTLIGEVNGTTYYIAHDSVEPGPRSKGWLLLDEANKSTKMQVEVECNSRQWRTLSVTAYSESRGAGRSESTLLRLSDWKTASPETLGWSWAEAICLLHNVTEAAVRAKAR